MRSELLVGLLAADSLYGIKMPSEIRERLASYSFLYSLLKDITALVLEAYPSSRTIHFGFTRETRILVSLRWHLHDKADVLIRGLVKIAFNLCRCIFIPTDKERVIICLPYYLEFGYYIIRPFRLSIKYFRLGVRRILKN